MKKLDLIFDTDAGSDCDDMMALGYLIYAEEHLGVNIRAVTHSHVSPHGAAAIRGTFRYFGKQPPPIGVMVGGNAFEDHYVGEVDRRFAVDEDRWQAESAVRVLRRALAECEDKAVICAVGPLTNIAALLESQPDDISPLDGESLIREKCLRAVLMAGKFSPDTMGRLTEEWNICCDIPSALIVARLFPSPLFWLPSETGTGIMTGKRLMDEYGMESPISTAFILFPWLDKEGRHSWDPAAAMFAVEGEKGLLRVARGRVCMAENGITTLVEDDQAEGGIILMREGGEAEAQYKRLTAEYLDSVVMSIHKELSNNRA